MKTLKKKKNIYETIFVAECEGIPVYNDQIRWRWQNASINLKMQYNRWHELNTKTNILAKTYEKEISPDNKEAVLKLIVEYERYKGKKKVSEKVNSLINIKEGEIFNLPWHQYATIVSVKEDRVVATNRTGRTKEFSRECIERYAKPIDVDKYSYDLKVRINLDGVNSIERIIKVTKEEIERIRPLFDAINNFKPYKGDDYIPYFVKTSEKRAGHIFNYNYPCGRYYPQYNMRELSKYEIYPHIPENMFNIFEKHICPYSEYGFRSVELVSLSNETSTEILVDQTNLL